MTLANYTRMIAAAVTMAMLAPQSTVAGEEFAPVQTLVLETREALSYEPEKVTLQGDVMYILGSNAAGVDVIEIRDTKTLDVLSLAPQELQVDDIAADPRGNALYVIGHDGQLSQLNVLDAKLAPIATKSMKNRLGYPKLSTTADGLLIVSGLRTDFSDGFLGALDIREPSDPQIRSDIYAGEAWGGVAGSWFDARSGALFLNAAWDSRLLALSTGKSYVMSEFGVQTDSGSLGDPYVVSALMGNRGCRNDGATSFLIADLNRDVLTLVDYNEPFQSLDTLSIVEFNLAPTRALSPALPGTDLRLPAGLLSSSCDQSVIFLGSRTSNEVAQFARNEFLSSLERVGTIRLPARPVDIDVSTAGDFAIAVSAENRTVMRFSTPAEDGGPKRIIGDADVRALQRALTEAGLPVGSIDGIIGAKTLRAVQIAEKKYGVKLDATGDIAKTVETLREAIK
ncbi:peptidoglycan-binding domain-containing protein [Roseobacter sp. EG26]|uniref:peptidoglycan-binding domain-containing protein n=1 Tax=Roseobacter sp. EG26 TaxID=3412477 RepID=UPI003CE46D11